MSAYRLLVKGLIGVVLFLKALPAFAQEQIDLPQAINYALAQNKELKRAMLSIDSGSLGVAGAKAENRKC